MKPCNSQIGGMFLSLSDKIWGNLRTPAARTAWAKAQTARCKAEDEQFRTELIDAGFPAAIVRIAWITGKSKQGAIEWLSNEHVVKFIQYHRLGDEIREAFKKYKP